ncbi:hypothetical protein Javan146_0008 [Streptococcus phage Javan146]|nr:hypothetical protein Javan146_0008 [Streptococcus phage Javan146]
MIAYHITHDIVEINQVYELLDPDLSIVQAEMKCLITNIYPEGLSRWGNYLYPQRSNAQNAGMMVYETFYEYERRLNFPDLPSRFQSMFATKSIEDLKMWLPTFQARNIPFFIWKIDTLDSKVIELDSNFLAGGDVFGLQTFSPVLTSFMASKYWNGSMTDNPKKELLVSPKIKFIEDVSNQLLDNV